MTENKSTSSGIQPYMPPLVLFLWASALKWLLIGLGVGFLASLKMHATALFANISFLNYGILQEVSETALVYGFLLQAVFAGCIWATAKLGNEAPGLGHVSSIGVFAWNILLTVGVIQIFINGTYGLKFMALSGSVLLGLVITSLFIVLPWVGRLLNSHDDNKIAPSYLLISLLVFPMIALPGGHFLHSAGITGVIQNVISQWYSHTLIFTLVPLFLMGILIFLVEEDPTVKGYSKSVPTASLWCILLGGFLGGLYHGFPVGGAVNALSVASVWFPAFGCVAIFLVLFGLANTNDNSHSVLNTFGLKWIAGGVMLALSLNAIASLESFAGSFGLTTFKPGLEQYILFGSLLMGAIFLIRVGIKGDFKPSAILCFSIYFGSLICLASYAIEAIAGNASGLRMNVAGLLVLFIVSVTQVLSITVACITASLGAIKGCCPAPQSKSVEKSKLANA